MTKKGFTLVELTVVIALIGILITIGTRFDFNKKTDIEKQSRFIEKISSMIHSTLMSTSSGRGVKSGTGIMNPTSTRIHFSTGAIGVYYYSGNTIAGTGEILQAPFFWETAYNINSIYWKNKDLSNSGLITSAEIVFDSDSNNTVFSGSNSESGVIMGMDIRYHSVKKTLEFDRRFGKITIQ